MREKRLELTALTVFDTNAIRSHVQFSKPKPLASVSLRAVWFVKFNEKTFWGILKSGENGGKCKEEKRWPESGQVLRESCARSARASGEHVLGWDVAPAVVCRRSPRDAAWMSEKQARLEVTARGVFMRCNIAFHHPPGMHRSVIAPPFSSFTRIISFLIPCFQVLDGHRLLLHPFTETTAWLEFSPLQHTRPRRRPIGRLGSSRPPEISKGHPRSRRSHLANFVFPVNFSHWRSWPQT